MIGICCFIFLRFGYIQNAFEKIFQTIKGRLKVPSSGAMFCPEHGCIVPSQVQAVWITSIRRNHHKMKLHHFENGEDQGKPYDMEQTNFFGLSIAYDPYKRELVDGKTLTTCGGDGGCNICGGMGPLLGYLPCSPHCKPEVREDNEIHNDYNFFRPVIRVQTSGWRIVSPENER